MAPTREKKRALRWARDKEWRRNTYNPWPSVEELDLPWHNAGRLRPRGQRQAQENYLATQPVRYQNVVANWPIGVPAPPMIDGLLVQSARNYDEVRVPAEILAGIVEFSMHQPNPHGPLRHLDETKHNTYFHQWAQMCTRLCKVSPRVEFAVIAHLQICAPHLLHTYRLSGLKAWHRLPALYPLDERLVRKVNIEVPLNVYWGVNNTWNDALRGSTSARKGIRRLRNLERHFHQFPRRTFSRMTLNLASLRDLPITKRSIDQRSGVVRWLEHQERYERGCPGYCYPGERPPREPFTPDSLWEMHEGDVILDRGCSVDPAAVKSSDSDGGSDAVPEQDRDADRESENDHESDEDYDSSRAHSDATDSLRSVSSSSGSDFTVTSAIQRMYNQEKQYYRAPVREPKRIDHLFFRLPAEKHAHYTRRDRKNLYDFTARYPDASKVTVEMYSDRRMGAPFSEHIQQARAQRANRLATNLRRRHQRTGRGITEFRLNIKHLNPARRGANEYSQAAEPEYWVLRHKFFPNESKWKRNEYQYMGGFPDEEAELNWPAAPMAQQRVAFTRIDTTGYGEHDNQDPDGAAEGWETDSTVDDMGMSDAENGSVDEGDSMQDGD